MDEWMEGHVMCVEGIDGYKRYEVCGGVLAGYT